MALTVKGVITMAGRLRDHAFGDEVALVWVNEAEGLVQTEVMLRAIEEVTQYGPDDMEAELLVQMPHGKLYYQYLVAKICEANGDYDEYANWQEQFERSMSEFQNWFCNRYHRHGAESPWLGYFISAYGIAVKHGFRGTEEEWLASLEGEPGTPPVLRGNADTGDIEWSPAGAEQWELLVPGSLLIQGIIAQTLEEAKASAEEAAGAAAAAGSMSGQATQARNEAVAAAESASASAAAAEAERTAAEAARDGAEAAARSATASADDARTQADTAGNYAQNAKTSESASATAAAAAQAAEQAAENSAASAGAAATSAAGAATAAKESAVTAQEARDTAGTRADAAALSSQKAEEAAQRAEAAAERAENAQGTGDGIAEEADPTVPDWAKQAQKPTYTAEEVGADPAGTASYTMAGHNTSINAHEDIRLLVQGLSDRLNTALNSTDTDLDQMAELVAYIKSNKSLIDAVTTSKVSVSDIVDNLATNVANKPLSAAQGVALKTLIDGLSTGKLDAGQLQTAVNDALTQARASGEFDGPAGPQGEDGHTPVKGVDYFTSDEVKEIAEQAAGLVKVPNRFETLAIGTEAEEGVSLQSEGEALAPVLALYGEHGDEPVRVSNVATAVGESDVPNLGQVRQLIGSGGGFLNDAGRRNVPAAVVFMDDDAKSEVFHGKGDGKATLWELIQELGIPYTLAVPPGHIGDDGFLSRDELMTMYNGGVGISCHHWRQYNMDQFATAEEYEADLIRCKEKFAELGIDDVISVSYPQGVIVDDYLPVARTHFRMGFGVVRDINTAPYSSYRMYRCETFPSDDTAPLETATARVDAVAEGGGILIFMTHAWYDSFDADILRQLVEYIRGKGIPILGVNEMIEKTGNVIDVGDYYDGQTEPYFVVTADGHVYANALHLGTATGNVEEDVTPTTWYTNAILSASTGKLVEKADRPHWWVSESINVDPGEVYRLNCSAIWGFAAFSVLNAEGGVELVYPVPNTDTGEVLTDHEITIPENGAVLRVAADINIQPDGFKVVRVGSGTASASADSGTAASAMSVSGAGRTGAAQLRAGAASRQVGGLTQAQVEALDGMFRIIADGGAERSNYSGAYAAFRAAFGLSGSGGGMLRR